MISFHTNDSHKKNLHCYYYEDKYFLWLLIKTISTKQKYIMIAHTPKIIVKKIYFLSSQHITRVEIA